MKLLFLAAAAALAFVGVGARRAMRCPAGHMECPTSFRAGFPVRWECVDVQNDLESCGGCVDFDFSVHEGRDCSAIEGVDTVQCFRGKCNVALCQKGYRTTKDGTSCEPEFSLQ